MNNSFFKAAILEKIKRNLKIKKLKLKNPEKNQILIKLKYSGVCRSQIMEIDGKRENKKWLPHMLGHEGTGIIIKLGPNVKNFKIGDRVFLSWIKKNKKDCDEINFFCKNKKINAGKITTFSSHSIISTNRVYHLPRSINLKMGALLGCAFPTGFGMIINNISKRKKIKLLIIGLGGVGLSSLIAAKSLKYINVDILEKNKAKIKYMQKFFKNKNFRFFSNDLSIKKNYYDNVVETSGDEKVISKSLDFIHNKGKVVFASHPDKKSKIEINPHDLIKGKKIIGSWGGNITFEKDMKKIIQIIKNSKFINKLFLNKIYSLNKVNLALNDLRKGKVIRPILKL